MPVPRKTRVGLTPEKQAEKEAVFRAANERLKDCLMGVVGGRPVPFICECSDAQCLGTVELPLAIRSEGARRFFVLPGHDRLGERVVRQEDSHVVVEKAAFRLTCRTRLAAS